ncbi:hypothetical protein COV17_03835 [Candidatus Woesearchaeota archaeon CG10_big_fil_rev_8_21_14_0_10_36_11]|nr:MAG: hypothetical protein COV17_03835 [Candidatus Woesearchaeota archaeon CG10_big_fil_rev_8_21_14_0_10_36_11]
MKYAHLADLHLGAWREEKMRILSTHAFLNAVDQCIKQHVDFILFAGDLFNTSLPDLNTLKTVTKKLKELQDKKIPIYIIAGSHDFSPSGKTMLDVLEHAGLLVNVCKGKVQDNELHLSFTTDTNTGAKITGVLGRRGLLDKTYYTTLHRESLEQEQGYKIFMFHTAVTELMPKELGMVESLPLSFFPKRFNYYAGGHIHNTKRINPPEYGTVTYPGALFPHNFQEMEKFGHGNYYIVTVEDGVQTVEDVPVIVKPCTSLELDCTGKSPDVITFEILDNFQEKDIIDTVITIKLKGTIRNGKVSDINFTEIFKQLYEKGAYFIMRNMTRLNSEEFEEIKIVQSNPEFVENDIINEHLQQMKTFDKETELHTIQSLMTVLNTTKKEGETITDFHTRTETEIDRLLQM